MEALRSRKCGTEVTPEVQASGIGSLQIITILSQLPLDTLDTTDG